MDFHFITRKERIALEYICNEMTMDSQDWSDETSHFPVHGEWIQGCVQIGIPKTSILSTVSSLVNKRIICSGKKTAYFTDTGRDWLKEHHDSMSI